MKPTSAQTSNTQSQKPGPTGAAASNAESQAPGSLKKQLAGLGFDAADKALEPPSVGSGSLFVDRNYARLIARDLAARAGGDANVLTDEVFYRLFPWLAGQKLAAKSPEAKAWVEVRDHAVVPELDALRDSMKPTGGKSDKSETKDTEGANAESDTEAGGAPIYAAGGKSSTADLYRTQNDNSYDDELANWKKDSAGSATCNMTAVAMALISIAGSEDVAKQAVALYLKKHGMRDGATAKIGGKRVALSKVLSDGSMLAKAQLEDLCIAAAVKIGGSYDSVTMTSIMLKVAKKSGLVKDGTAYASTEKMTDPAVLERAKELLASGNRVIVGTVNHYVYLTAVRDDGILVHDPAGARVSVSGDPKYLWPGKASDKLGHWDSALRKDSLREVALRRVSHNPEVLAAFTQEAAALSLSGDEKKAAREAVKQDHPGTLNTGANNFYGLDELAEYNCRIRVVMTPNEGPQAEEGKTPG